MKKPNPIKFGTDGWRAVIGEDFTRENVCHCAQGVAGYLKQEGLTGRGLVIGYDTRFASADFAAAAAEVIAANGIRAYLTPAPTPTPVVSYGVLARGSAGAVIITASHNPAEWNGFKYKDEHGASAPDALTAAMVKHINASYEAGRYEAMPLAGAKERGLVIETDLAPVYFEQIARLVDLDRLKNAGLNLVIDPMYGAGAGYLKKALEGGNNQITEIHGQPDPDFPGLHPEPIMPHLSELAEAVKNNKATAGLATDGDADRMGIVDEKGNFVTQLQVFALLCLYLLEVRGERGAIVKSLTTTGMADRLGELYGVPVRETAVGFKYIAPVMLAENALIGGEESGGYGFRGHVAERDGILASLLFLDLMVSTGKSITQLIKHLYDKVGPHHYRRIDIKFPEAERENIVARVSKDVPGKLDGVRVLRRDDTDGYRFILADNTWLLVRFSGTEPLLRIYAETDSPERAARLLKIGRGMAGV